MSMTRGDLRSQQVLQDVFVLDGRRSVILAVLFDLFISIFLPEQRHLDAKAVELTRNVIK